MFTYEQIHSLNDLEFEVYNYIVKNRDKVLNMRIRELAQEVHVSTTTILRFCKKMGCEGYSEFKVKLKMTKFMDQQEVMTHTGVALDYLKQIETEEKNKLTEKAVTLIHQAQRVIFLGAGSSGIMAKYGARYLTNIGKHAQCIDDAYYPVTDEDCTGTVLIVLSVSGETDEIIYRLNHFKGLNAKIISITNTDTSTIAKMADIAISYYVPKEEIYVFDITTQVPVIYLIEVIGKKLHKLRKEAILTLESKLL